MLEDNHTCGPMTIKDKTRKLVEDTDNTWTLGYSDGWYNIGYQFE